MHPCCVDAPREGWCLLTLAALRRARCPGRVGLRGEPGPRQRRWRSSGDEVLGVSRGSGRLRDRRTEARCAVVELGGLTFALKHPACRHRRPPGRQRICERWGVAEPPSNDGLFRAPLGGRHTQWLAGVARRLPVAPADQLAYNVVRSAAVRAGSRRRRASPATRPHGGRATTVPATSNAGDLVTPPSQPAPWWGRPTSHATHDNRTYVRLATRNRDLRSRVSAVASAAAVVV